MSTFKRDYMKHDIFNISFALYLLYSVFHLTVNKNNVKIVSETYFFKFLWNYFTWKSLKSVLTKLISNWCTFLSMLVIMNDLETFMRSISWMRWNTCGKINTTYRLGHSFFFLLHKKFLFLHIIFVNTNWLLCTLKL